MWRDSRNSSTKQNVWSGLDADLSHGGCSVAENGGKDGDAAGHWTTPRNRSWCRAESARVYLSQGHLLSM